MLEGAGHAWNFATTTRFSALERTATADQIKTAYRRLARKYHPDVSKEKNAEALQGDAGGLRGSEGSARSAPPTISSAASGSPGQQFRPPPDWGSGFEFGAARRRAAARSGRRHRAGTGEGTPRRTSAISSPRSSAAARPSRGARAARQARSSRARSTSTSRRPSAARRARSSSSARSCSRTARVEMRSHTVRVTIPAGVTEGQLIRLAGQGERRARGRQRRRPVPRDAHPSGPALPARWPRCDAHLAGGAVGSRARGQCHRADARRPGGYAIFRPAPSRDRSCGCEAADSPASPRATSMCS